jgi:hypothetical protein
MTDREHMPSQDAERRNPRPVDPHLVRNLTIVLVIVVLGFGFGRPLAAGYYFGGCDNAEDTQHYVIHVFGVDMCRDVPIASGAETSERREAEAVSALEEPTAEEEAPPAPRVAPSGPGASETAPT